MAVPFVTNLYLPCAAMFARPITVMPIASQPGAGAYDARGIWNSEDYGFDTYDDAAVVSDGRNILDIQATEFPVLPRKFDLIRIPVDQLVAGGDFEVEDVSADNGAGEITLTLRAIIEPKMFAYLFGVAPAYSLGAPDFATPALTEILMAELSDDRAAA